MNKKFLLLYLISVFLCLVSCKQQTDDSELLTVRISVISNGNGGVSVTAYPENQDGFIVDGAYLYVLNSSNQITTLTFNNSSRCYECTLDDYIDSEINLYVRSNLLSQTLKYTIPHIELSQKPVFNVLQDSEANSALASNSLNSKDEIQIGWEKLQPGNSSSDNEIAYIVDVKSTSKAIYSVSTYSNNIVIPAEVLPENSILYVTVTAQLIYGDITYTTENYYSVSAIKSSSFTIYTD